MTAAGPVFLAVPVFMAVAVFLDGARAVPGAVGVGVLMAHVIQSAAFHPLQHLDNSGVPAAATRSQPGTAPVAPAHRGRSVPARMQVPTYTDLMDDRLFGEDDLLHVVSREGVLIAAGGAAALLQTAHPRVAQGVHEHSYTARDPMARLRHTMGWVYAVTCGSRAEAERLSTAVRRLHGRVTGDGYRADDPELQAWVAATLFAVGAQMYGRLFRRRFTPAELEAYYQQSKVYATILGCPEEALPATYPDFRRYYARMLATLKINDASRTIARQVLYPAVPKAYEPVFMAIRLITAGLMPEPIRRQYGWSWNRARRLRFRLLMGALSLVYPRLPLRLRTLPCRYYLRRARQTRRERRGDEGNTASAPPPRDHGPGPGAPSSRSGLRDPAEVSHSWCGLRRSRCRPSSG